MTSTLPSSARGIGIAGTTIAHAALIAAMILGARGSAVKGPVVYEVNLIAAPLPSAGSRTADATKEPAPKAVAPPVKPKVAPPVVKPKVAPVQAKSDPKPLVKSPVVPADGVKPSTGVDVVTVHQEGLVFPFPEYLRNIENMINKRWIHAMYRAGLEVRIAFVISRDGSVPQLSFFVDKSSGNSSFDDAAQAAIESVSFNHEFRPLPDGFTGVSLPILFIFKQVARSGP